MFSLILFVLFASSLQLYSFFVVVLFKANFLPQVAIVQLYWCIKFEQNNKETRAFGKLASGKKIKKYI